MIFTPFNPDTDIVLGRTLRVTSGVWPNNGTSISQSTMVGDYYSLTGSIGNPSYGTSVYDIRRTAYYLNVFPTINEFNNNDPYLSVSYGNIAGEYGSGSYNSDINFSNVFPTKAIYTEYKNLLLGSTLNASSTFVMNTGSSTIKANDIFVISFSTYKMKDNIDAGGIQFSLSGSNGNFTFIDDSPFQSSVQTSYQIISGSLTSLPSTPNYQGIGVFYPASGIIVLNASVIANLVGFNSLLGNSTFSYNPGISTVDYTVNHQVFFLSLTLANNTFITQDSEYVPSTQYYVRVMNKLFNYSNNPTFVYDGTDGVHPQGLIYNSDFISNPQTYITTVGLYNNSNELVAVAKLSKPAVKSFNNEITLKVQINT